MNKKKIEIDLEIKDYKVLKKTADNFNKSIDSYINSLLKAEVKFIQNGCIFQKK
jgi:hypothetical protein